LFAVELEVRCRSPHHLPHGANVLDVCSGTHDIPLRLFAIDPTLKIHAVDGSADMTAEGQRRARERNLAIQAQVCDAHALPFADNSFDAVTLQFASRHLEIIRAFKEIYRVLKPGGIFCHNDMLRPASRVVEVPYLTYLRFSVWFTAKLFGSSAESMKCVGYFANAIRYFYTPRELDQLLKEIGFVGIESRNFITGIMSYHISRKPPSFEQPADSPTNPNATRPEAPVGQNANVRFGSKADMCSATKDVRFVPKADINGLFDDLIDAGE
jgi:demethylmenaquinone methyltransferase/2-methoxy-6-polyprenyl-1,4-benzoquinol methylase